MCVCVYACVNAFVCMCTCVHGCGHICVHLSCTWVCMSCVQMHLCACEDECVHKLVCTQAGACVFIWVCTWAVHMCVRMCVCMSWACVCGCTCIWKLEDNLWCHCSGIISSQTMCLSSVEVTRWVCGQWAQNGLPSPGIWSMHHHTGFLKHGLWQVTLKSSCLQVKSFMTDLWSHRQHCFDFILYYCLKYTDFIFIVLVILFFFPHWEILAWFFFQFFQSPSLFLFYSTSSLLLFSPLYLTILLLYFSSFPVFFFKKNLIQLLFLNFILNHFFKPYRHFKAVGRWSLVMYQWAIIAVKWICLFYALMSLLEQ